ncbi:MAG: hypothetical protein EP343_25005 [Deltaproteobacteria bacterium]|nr:MAG: hypothetical protein EP343_25005 [Deltaproteobacteria bacterium]
MKTIGFSVYRLPPLVAIVGLMLWWSVAGCSAPPPNPNPSCVAGGCPAGTECIQETLCLTVCPTGMTRCGLLCTDLQLDKANCGGCGTACKTGEVCAAGLCKPLSEAIPCSPACPTGQTCVGGTCVCPQGESMCGGTCATLLSSSQHCGACNNACAGNATCQQGKCSCSGGQSYCNGQCVDTKTSDQHCGACGNACNAGFFCDVGTCMCLGGQSDCNGTCVDVNTSAAHCGACGNACLRTQSCNQGKCQCPTGETACGAGASAACVNLKTDMTHCGTCGNTCPTEQSCINGKCVAIKTCPNGEADCGGTCVNLNTDSKHCGACGSTCKAGEACVGGSCKIVQCKQGESKCANQCVELQTNSTHCGGCFNSCRLTHRCTAGQCVPMCQTGESLCGEVCVNPKTNNQHCGGCGKACAQGSYCKDGACTSFCSGNLTACFNGCVDLQIDRSNCGQCGTRCDECKAGQCLCNYGKFNCNNECADFKTDFRHCGGCGKQCAADEDCENSICGKYTYTWYPDLDKDGFGDKNAKPFVGLQRYAPPGWVKNNKDCCDVDPKAHPNQTDYFDKPNLCKSYDYNCDGQDTVEKPVCTCSKNVKWSLSTFQMSVRLQDADLGERNATVFAKKDLPATLASSPSPSQTSCAMTQGKFTFENPSTFKLSFRCSYYTETSKELGPYSTSWQFPGAAAQTPTPPIKWLPSAYKEGCLFHVSGATPKCGDTNLSVAPKTMSNTFSINNRVLYKLYRHCGVYKMYESLYLIGTLTVDSGYTLSSYPTKTEPSIRCR